MPRGLKPPATIGSRSARNAFGVCRGAAFDGSPAFQGRDCRPTIHYVAERRLICDHWGSAANHSCVAPRRRERWLPCSRGLKPPATVGSRSARNTIGIGHGAAFDGSPAFQGRDCRPMIRYVAERRLIHDHWGSAAGHPCVAPRRRECWLPCFGG